MKIKGIKRGRTIELSEDVNIPDGQEVNVEIEVIQQMSNEERLEKMKQLLDNWEAREDFVNTMKMLEEEKRIEREKLYGNPS